MRSEEELEAMDEARKNVPTPRPWEARKGRANTSVYVAGTQCAVAVGCKDADARLIAAAPDLLAALNAILPYALNENDALYECEKRYGDDCGAAACLAAIDAARAAIADAEGKPRPPSLVAMAEELEELE